MIIATPGAAAILVNPEDWFGLFRPAPKSEIMPTGQIIYRGLVVWILEAGETRVLTAVEAKREGYNRLGG